MLQSSKLCWHGFNLLQQVSSSWVPTSYYNWYLSWSYEIWKFLTNKCFPWHLIKISIVIPFSASILVTSSPLLPLQERQAWHMIPGGPHPFQSVGMKEGATIDSHGISQQCSKIKFVSFLKICPEFQNIVRDISWQWHFQQYIFQAIKCLGLILPCEQREITWEELLFFLAIY